MSTTVSGADFRAKLLSLGFTPRPSGAKVTHYRDGAHSATVVERPDGQDVTIRNPPVIAVRGRDLLDRIVG